MDLLKLQNEIHQQNKDMGWWDTPRTFDVFICLFHSELSEAMEGDRKNLMDNHLPHYEMFWVEMADFVIRVMDYLGSEGNDYYYNAYFEDSDLNKFGRTGFIARLHSCISGSFDSEDSEDIEDVTGGLTACVECCFEYARQNDTNLLQIIDEKRAYNLTRADHKPENRAKANGKKY